MNKLRLSRAEALTLIRLENPTLSEVMRRILHYEPSFHIKRPAVSLMCCRVCTEWTNTSWKETRLHEEACAREHLAKLIARFGIAVKEDVDEPHA